MKSLDLSKIFWSKCRTKILEKFYLEYESWNNEWFHMRALSRDLDEQINSIKRELDNLSELWILKSKMQLKRKIFCINDNFFLANEFTKIFLKSYNPISKVKQYLKNIVSLELVIVNESVKNKLFENGKNILDIFLIGEVEKTELNSFLASTFYNRKVKYAIIPTSDFYNRIEFWDKLIKNILTEKWNIFVKDNLNIKEKLGL